MKKKKICLSAYAYGNLGDDLFIKIICDRYPNVQFFIHGAKAQKSIYENIKNLKFLCSDKRSLNSVTYKLLKLIKIDLPSLLNPPKADAHVKIGGSLFMETKGWEEIYNHHNEFIKYYSQNYLLGANFGPYHSDEFFNKFKTYFQKYDDICFRDTYSANLFPDLNNVRQAEDIVFQLEHKTQGIENYYVISLINCADRESLKEYHSAYFEKLTEIIDKITQKGNDVVLMGFCYAEKDNLAIDELYEKLENKERVIKYNHYNINNSLDIIAKSKGMIATRFHAMILGLSFEKATIPLLYSDKMRTVLEDMNYNGVYYHIKNIHEVNADEVIENLENKCEFDIQPIKTRAEKHFQELDKFLLNNK